MQEVEQGETENPPKGEGKQKMGTEEGAKELRDTAEEKTGPCPVCKQKHEPCPGDPFRGPATGYRSARPSKP